MASRACIGNGMCASGSVSQPQFHPPRFYSLCEFPAAALLEACCHISEHKLIDASLRAPRRSCRAISGPWLRHARNVDLTESNVTEPGQFAVAARDLGIAANIQSGIPLRHMSIMLKTWSPRLLRWNSSCKAQENRSLKPALEVENQG